MLSRKILSVFLLYAFLLPTVAFGQAAAPAPFQAPKEVIDKIKDEGTNRSQVMQTLSYLTDVIGGRLTNSPQMKRANEWTRDTMTKWGLQNARLEAWGPFGRGWSLKSFSAQVVSPQGIPVIAYPKAWSPSTKGVVTNDVVHLDVKDEADFAKYKGKLNGKIVLISGTRDLKAEEKPLSARRTDEELTKMTSEGEAVFQRQQQAQTQPQAQPQQPSPQQMERLKRFTTSLKATNFLLEEGAAVVVDNSSAGSGGTLFVSGANVAQEVPANPLEIFSRRNRLQPYQKEAEAKMLPQITMASEDYNRLVRMLRQGEKLKMSVDVQTQYHDEDLMGHNTTAEIVGTDLKDEVVMLGGHMDSWHSATGATDNAAGVAVAMEAVRILQTLGLKPRRTIRVGLWSGEEQGLLGSRAYVKQHFGEMQTGNAADGQQAKPELVKKPEYEKLSAYYNLDNGTGKIRGVYQQGNSSVAPIFRAWLEPFKDMGANTLTLANTGGTDHLAFDAIGLPGFQFIQDEIEYDTRTHHSNQDNYDRIQADDMKQAAMIMAAFVYQTAMMDEKLPRKAMK
ncbi:MAG: M20/M25/M40 family metallo-hydrolase [Acidobacteriota bacterium]|nr:M20/M25/M40 family metallo-hydrolase [Acidobacteriota bacterium]